MRYAMIENNIVVNLIEADEDFAKISGAVAADGASIGDIFENGLFKKPSPPPLDRAALMTEIDLEAKRVYETVTPFIEEYKLRESQAIAFQKENYIGDVPRQVAAYANRVGKSAQESTILILWQADKLRAALDDIADLRMRKFELASEQITDIEAIELKGQVVMSIKAIGSSL